MLLSFFINQLEQLGPNKWNSKIGEQDHQKLSKCWISVVFRLMNCITIGWFKTGLGPWGIPASTQALLGCCPWEKRGRTELTYFLPEKKPSAFHILSNFRSFWWSFHIFIFCAKKCQIKTWNFSDNILIQRRKHSSLEHVGSKLRCEITNSKGIKRFQPLAFHDFKRLQQNHLSQPRCVTWAPAAFLQAWHCQSPGRHLKRPSKATKQCLIIYVNPSLYKTSIVKQCLILKPIYI